MICIDAVSLVVQRADGKGTGFELTNIDDGGVCAATAKKMQLKPSGQA